MALIEKLTEDRAFTHFSVAYTSALGGFVLVLAIDAILVIAGVLP
jgi:hypothetical protein